MSERGVFAVDRGIWDHDVFQDSAPLSRREAWLWLLSEAAWKPHRRRIAGRVIDVARGQVAASLRFIASKWRWSEPRVRRFLSLLRNEGMIGAQTDAGLSVITISKYDEYQRVSLPSDATNNREVDASPTQERRKVEDREYKEVTKTKIRDKSLTGAVADATRPNAGKLFDEEFWPAYPKRDGANPRKPARDKFLIAVKSGHDPQAIIGGLRRYAGDLAKSNQIGTKYVAQAVTWINQARWEDYPIEAATEPTGPPQPPNPSLPSHEDLKRKYEQANGKQTPQEGTGIRGEGAGLCDPAERRPEDDGAASDNKTRISGMAGMGAILHRTPGLRAFCDEAGEDGRGTGDDRPGPMARVV